MNTLISIGYLGIKHCYLNISELEAIEKYCKSLDYTIEDFNEFGLNEQINIFKFDDEFEAYGIYPT